MASPYAKVVKLLDSIKKPLIEQFADSVVSAYTPTTPGAEVADTFLAADAGPRETKAKLAKLPIFLVIGHSSMDSYISTRMKDGDIEPYLNNVSTCSKSVFCLPPGGDISEAKFVVYTTGPGGLGLLGDEACPGEDEESHHILNAKEEIVKGALFSPEMGHQEKIDVSFYGREKEGKVHFKCGDAPTGLFYPGCVVPDKGHEFYGSTLTEYGFGIFRIRQGESACALAKAAEQTGMRRSHETIIESEDDEGEEENAKVYYYSSQALTPGDRAVKELLTEGARSRKNVFMSEIIKAGDPGIYISLSCSPLWVFLEKPRDGSSSEEDRWVLLPRDPWIIKTGAGMLVTEIQRALAAGIRAAGEQWDQMTQTLARSGVHLRSPGGVQRPGADTAISGYAADDQHATIDERADLLSGASKIPAVAVTRGEEKRREAAASDMDYPELSGALRALRPSAIERARSTKRGGRRRQRRRRVTRRKRRSKRRRRARRRRRRTRRKR